MWSEGTVPPFLTSVLDEDGWSASRPGHFIPRERDTGIHCIESFVDSRAGLDAEENIKCSYSSWKSNSDSLRVQSVARHNAVWAIKNKGKYYERMTTKRSIIKIIHILIKAELHIVALQPVACPRLWNIIRVLLPFHINWHAFHKYLFIIIICGVGLSP
jgi:hypothetical protein